MPPRDQRPIAYSRLSSPLPVSEKVQARATRGQSVVEYGLFGAAALFIIVAVIALYTSNSPDHQKVPSSIAAGWKSGRLNLLLIQTDRRSQPLAAKDWAANLTLLSVRPAAHEAALLTIPRDLWVKLGAYGTHRVDAANTIGNSSGYPGEGPGLTMDTVARITGQPVHGFLCLDASDLQMVIDRLGGIDLDVKRPMYEIRTRRRFLSGWQHMTGATAVLYANSTDVLGPEGDRFARERRQHQLLIAMARKVSTDPGRRGFSVIADLVRESPDIRTNVQPQELASLYDTLNRMPAGALRIRSMQALTTAMEINSIADSGEVLKPRSGTFAEIQQLARDPFSPATAVSNARVTTQRGSRATFAALR